MREARHGKVQASPQTSLFESGAFLGCERHKGALPLALCPPLIKYVGAKRWLPALILPRLHCHLSNIDGVFGEPFCGGLALGLGLGWPASIFSDANPDLMALYQALAADASGVANELEILAARTTTPKGVYDERSFREKVYYEIRQEVWPENRLKFTPAELAARFVYLNKNGFNGLFRVNRKGQFNAAWGKRAPAYPARAHVLRVGKLLAAAELLQGDFADALAWLELSAPAKRLAIFFDPPYDGALQAATTRGAQPRKSAKKAFTGYTVGKFTWEDQVRLAGHASRLARAGALIIASNTWSEEICDLYRADFALFQVGVHHGVGLTAASRGRRAELLAISHTHAGILDLSGSKLRHQQVEAI